MAANSIVQARIEPEIKDRATAVLASMGLSLSDAVRILLTKVANEGALPAGLTTSPEEYDRWFRAKVQEALDDPRPDYSNDDVEAHFARRRAETLRKMRAK